MKYLNKICKAIVVGLLIIVISGIIALSLYNANQFKRLIITQIQQYTGVKINVADNITWSLLPNLGIKVKTLALTAADQHDFLLQDLKILVPLKSLLFFVANTKFDIDVKQLKFGSLVCDDLNALITLDQQKTILQAIGGTCAQGRVYGTGLIDHVDGIANVTFSGYWHDINLANLIANWSGKPVISLFSGQGDINLTDLKFVGFNAAAMKKSLNGKIDFTIKHGALFDLDLDFYFALANAFMNHQTLPQHVNSHKTVFDSLTGSGIIRDRVFYNQELLLESPYYVVFGQGKVNLNDNTVDYVLQVQVKPQNPAAVKLLQGKKFKLIISGSPDQLLIKLDKISLLQEFSKAKLAATMSKIKQYIPQADAVFKKLFVAQ